jgi:hypothetical protein
MHASLVRVETDGLPDIISWQPHGRAFVIHKSNEFISSVMPKCFRMSKFPSLHRQIQINCFSRLTFANDTGGYCRERFLPGKQHLCKNMFRLPVKGTATYRPHSSESEPDFNTMPPVDEMGHGATDPSPFRHMVLRVGCTTHLCPVFWIHGVVTMVTAMAVASVFERDCFRQKVMSQIEITVAVLAFKSR